MRTRNSLAPGAWDAASGVEGDDDEAWLVRDARAERRFTVDSAVGEAFAPRRGRRERPGVAAARVESAVEKILEQPPWFGATGRVESPIRRTRDFTPRQRFLSPDTGSPGSVLEQYVVMQSPNDDGRNSTVLFVRDARGSGRYAAKVQQAHQTQRRHIAREFAIHSELSQLYYRSQSANFVLIFDCVEQRDAVPLSELRRDSPLSSPKAVRKRARIAPAASPESTSVFYILELGGQSLDRYFLSTGKTMKPRVYIEIWFQLIYALLVSGREFGFTHNDLHMRNVLVSDVPHGRRAVAYFDNTSDEDGEVHAWFTSHIAIKIADFGLSRMRAAGADGKPVVLYNTECRDLTYAMWQPHRDVEKLMDELGRRCPPTVTGRQRQTWKDFRHLVRSEKYQDNVSWLRALLHHDLFSCLAAPPTDIAPSETVAVAVQGESYIPATYRAHALYQAAAPKPTQNGKPFRSRR